jgi:hypothetical protein
MAVESVGESWPKAGALLAALGISWCLFQFAIIVWPQQPMVARPLHLFFALAVLFRITPGPRVLNAALSALSGAVGIYYLTSAGGSRGGRGPDPAG